MNPRKCTHLVTLYFLYFINPLKSVDFLNWERNYFFESPRGEPPGLPGWPGACSPPRPRHRLTQADTVVPVELDPSDQC